VLISILRQRRLEGTASEGALATANAHALLDDKLAQLHNKKMNSIPFCDLALIFFRHVWPLQVRL
jgi:hypothetical protein